MKNDKSIEHYLDLFEQAVTQQAELVGKEKAVKQAKKAGLGISKAGKVVSIVGNPALVLLRLIKFFTDNNNVAALATCSPLIAEIDRMQELFSVPAQT